MPSTAEGVNVKHAAAQALRRIARTCIGWSTKLEPVYAAPSLNLGTVDGWPWVTYAERTDGFQGF